MALVLGAKRFDDLLRGPMVSKVRGFGMPVGDVEAHFIETIHVGLLETETESATNFFQQDMMRTNTYESLLYVKSQFPNVEVRIKTIQPCLLIRHQLRETA